MILQIIQQILGVALFLLPGILLSYIIFSKIDIIKRAVYSIVLAISILTILGAFLYLLNLLTSINIILSLIFLILLFLLILKLGNKRHKTEFNKDIWYLIFFSLVGTAWRLWFLNSVKSFGDAYGYATKFIGKAVPNLGFYTGIATDRASYIGLKASESIFRSFSLNITYLNIFLITFIFLGFIYLVFSEYRNRKLAYLGVALMALGPIELFHSTLSITGHSLSYLSLFPLFLLFKSEEKKIFWVALLLATAMMFTYYTTSMVMLLASVCFIIALFIKELIKTKNLARTLRNSLTNKKILLFLLIITILASYVYLFSNMLTFSVKEAQDFSTIKKTTSSIVKKTTIKTDSFPTDSFPTDSFPTDSFPTDSFPNKYKDPTFLGFSAIGWQSIFFLLCGLTFIFYIIRKRNFSENNIDLLLCLIPVSIISYGFLHVDYQTRIFDYFAFFGLLVINIPKKYFKIFFILSFIFILISGFYVVKDRKMFFEKSEEEIEAALWISNSLQGKVFSDQVFINHLISNGCYNVTGARDDDPLVYNLFYQNDPSVFLETIEILNVNFNVDYIALTKRMQEQYILMLNFPQKSLITTELYEENLIKVYDNGDVKVYEAKR